MKTQRQIPGPQIFPSWIDINSFLEVRLKGHILFLDNCIGNPLIVSAFIQHIIIVET